MARRLILPVYAAWMLVLAVIYFLIPPSNVCAAVWLVIGLSGTGAVLGGVARHRPSRPLPWLLLAGAMLGYTGGDAVYYFGRDGPPTGQGRLVDDLIYLAMFILLMAGLLQFGRPTTRGAALDALIVMCGGGLLTWIVLVQPNAAASASDLSQITSIAYPLGDVAILAAVTRLIRSFRLNVSTIMLAVGGGGLLVSDAVYRIADLGYTLGDVVGVGWFAFYAGWGAAALDPSMRTLTEPPIERGRDTTRFSLALLTMSSLIPPAVLLYEAMTVGPVKDGVVIAIACAAMGVLVLARLAGVGSRLQAQIVRERGLRTVTTSLVSAAELGDVAAAIKPGIAELMPPGVDYRAVLLESLHAPPELRGLRAERIVATSTLPGPLADQMRAHEAVMLCPLVLADRPLGDTQLGILLVAAPERVLRAVRAPLLALTAQAALAMDRVQLGQELVRRNNEEYFRALVHNTADVILILDSEERIRYASPSATAMFGTQGIAGTPLLDLVEEADRQVAAGELAAVRSHGDAAEVGSDWAVRGPSGPPLQVETSWRDLRADPTVQGTVVTLRDVTEQRRLERELTHRAYHDALTGLPNRALFAERIQQALAHVQQGGGTLLGVLLLDLDDFKIVNDTLGHDLGDELLIGVSHRLTEVLRHRDLAARLGGDEFAVVIEDATDPAAIEEVAARIVTAFREPFSLDGQQVNGSVSVGVATSADAPASADLLRHADLALYVAKGDGKSQWRRYQPDLHTAITQRLTLRTELDAALAEGQLQLEYQPIVALSTGATAGFEALVRWNHPTRGRLLPHDFIDLAEESGLIEPMGDWVLRAALAAAADWYRLGRLNGLYVSVNVSASQFRDSSFADRVLGEVSFHRLAPNALMLEITESLLVRDDDRLWRDLARLRRAGVRIAIDDFGTGYSSLSYLRSVPLDVLKIDRLFTSTITASRKQRALVDGIIQLAQTLGLQVVAEGVESSAERTLLTELGCPFGQGYLFATPLPLADTMDWLREH